MFERSQQPSPAAGDPGRIRTRNPREERNPLRDLVERSGINRIVNEPFLTIDRRKHTADRCVRAALNAKLRRSRLPAWQGPASAMSYATFSRVHSIAMRPSTFNALLFDMRRSPAQGVPS